MTNSGKVINIEDLQQEDGIIGYNGNGYSKEPITRMNPPAKKNCYRITTEGNHTIECSDDHPLLTNGDKETKRLSTFKLAKELNIGDKLMMLSEIPLFGDKHIDEARVLGLMIGDGCCLNSRLSCDPEIYDYVNSKYETTIHKELVTKEG